MDLFFCGGGGEVRVQGLGLSVFFFFFFGGGGGGVL